MPALYLLCFFAFTLCHSSGQFVDFSQPFAGSCSGPGETGPCRAALRRWFYNTETKTCEQFIYGGCRGNPANRFESKAECEQTCSLHSFDLPVDKCSLRPDPGPCKGYGLRWYFDENSGRCERFVYGLCRGNGNNFKSLHECQNACHKDCYQAPCFANPCDVTTCDKNPKAECVSNYCNGCTAEFYLGTERVKCGPKSPPEPQCIKESGTCTKDTMILATVSSDTDPCCKGTSCCIRSPGIVPVDYVPPENPTGTCEKECIPYP